MKILLFESYFNKKTQQLTDAGTNVLLVGMVFASWFLFPVLLKLLAYTQFQIGFLFISVLVLVLLIRYSKLNPLDWSGWHKWFVLLWSVYLLFLLAASIRSGDLYSLKQCCIILYKVMFFAILIFYMKRNFSACSFKLYSNFMVLVALLALVVTAAVPLGLMHSIQSMNDVVAAQGYDFSVYWGSFYDPYLRVYKFESFYWKRMIGLSDEPGTFAFALLPALYWFLIVEKSIVRLLIIAVAVLACFSRGAELAIFLLLFLMLKVVPFRNNRYMLVMISIVCVLGVSMLFVFYNSFFGLSVLLSGGGRLDPVLKSFEYLLVHPFGVGSALGMEKLQSFNIGYSNAMVESGYIGGLAYCAMFGLLFWKALAACLSVDMNEYEGKVLFAVGIAVIILLFMGAQRQAPDSSLWHMWIYACFFYLTMKKKELTTENNGVEGQKQ